MRRDPPTLKELNEAMRVLRGAYAIAKQQNPDEVHALASTIVDLQDANADLARIAEQERAAPGTVTKMVQDYRTLHRAMKYLDVCLGELFRRHPDIPSTADEEVDEGNGPSGLTMREAGVLRHHYLRAKGAVDHMEREYFPDPPIA